MHLAKRIGTASLISIAVLLLTAGPSHTLFPRINADPARYRTKEVAIVGRSEIVMERLVRAPTRLMTDTVDFGW